MNKARGAWSAYFMLYMTPIGCTIFTWLPVLHMILPLLLLHPGIFDADRSEILGLRVWALVHSLTKRRQDVLLSMRIHESIQPQSFEMLTL